MSSNRNNSKNNNIVARSKQGTPGSNMVWTNEAVSEADFMVFRDALTNKIVNVVAPNGLQVGLFDENFPGNLTATGHITGSGQIYAHHDVTARLGFTGSLQKLYNGNDFLQEGSNVTITNNADGSISIAANASSTTANALTAGSGLTMGGSTFDGSAARTIKIDINSESSVAAATGDFVLIHDLTDGTLKKTTVGSIQGSGATIDIAGLSNSLNETTLAQGDLFAVADIDAANETKKITVQDFSQFLAGETNGGLDETSGKLKLDLNDLSSVTPDVSADSLAFVDAGDSSTKKSTIATLVTGIAGTVTSTGLGSSAGTLKVDITNQTSVGSLASGDEVLIYDIDAAALKKATVSDFSVGAAPVDAEYVVLSSNGTLSNEAVLTAGDGLDLTSATLSLDLKSSSGLKIDSTELAIEPADFAGTGLEDDGSDNLRISTSAAGTGLSGGGGSALSVDYGSSAGTAVQGNTTFAFSAGHGLSGGIGSTAIGSGISGNFDVEPEEFAGLGLNTSGNKNNVYLQAGASILITTGSDDSIVISATSSGGGAVGTITQVTAGTGLSGGGSSGNVTLAIDDSVVATLTGSQFSGHIGVTGSISNTTFVTSSLLSAFALSGSLTKLENGNDYLLPGPGITLTTGSDGSITINTSESGGTIGDAEDGTYEDGIFTDFVPSTPTGTAIDRFNELFKLLAPAPAPDLDNVDVDTTDGITALLSFGASNNQFFESPSYASSSVEAGFASVDVNGSYGPSTSGANIRKGIYTGTTIVSGTLNEDVAVNQHNSGVVNHVANAFGDANTGTLQLYVNGEIVQSVDLTQASSGTGVPGSGTGTQLNSNSSGFVTLSQTGSAVQSTGVNFETFQHRTGQFQVGVADQRNGWNYARVVHDKGSTSVTTNYVEWINDSNNDALAAAGNSIEFTGSGSIHLSGVEYFQSGTITYKSRVTNAYKYVHDNNAIQFPTADASASESGLSFSLANQSKPTIDTAGGETHAKVLHLTSSATINANYFLSGTITAGTTVTHPHKSDLTNAGQSTTDRLLVYNLANSSTALVETFRREDFRIVSASYDTQASIVDAPNIWNSETYMTSSNAGHSNGLQFFNEKLLSPKNTINGGNFSIFASGPSENPNYSAVSGTRTFLRWFKNETGSTQYDFSLAITGTGTIVTEGTALTGDRISVLIRRPPATGYMDLASAFVLDSVGDTAGAHTANSVISFDNSLDATNYVNFGNVGVADDAYVVVKIIADANWTGNISNITVAYGAGTGTLTPVPDLDDIDVDPDGTDANLSFGAAKTISGYANPTSAAGFTAADLNDLYQTAENSNNLRASVFNGTVTIEGDLNADVSSPGNDFFARTFSDANSGSLKLEVNGAVIHTVEITGSQTLIGSAAPPSGDGSSVNSDGSGFTSISRWEPGLFDNGVPRYSEIQRSAKYKIVAASQRPGWNYARVIHTVGGSDRTTNYVEWINDADANALSGSDSISVFGDNSFSYLSGVKYFNSPSGSLRSEIHHIYKNVYSDSDSAISFTSLTNATAAQIIQSGSGLSSTKTTNAATDSLQTLATSTDSQNQILHVTGTLNFSQSKSLPGTYTTAYSCGGRMVFDHPLKTNLTTSAQTKTNLLVWTPSDTSNANTNEYFTGETYRLISGSYTAQSDITGGSRTWNSQRSMNDQGSYPEHATGLLIYDTYLIPPKDGGSSGDFRNHTEGGGIESPLGNVNYSSGVLTNSTRDYYRSFLNNTSNDRPSVQITLVGDATIVGLTGANAAALGANKNIYVEVAIPGKTGFLDLGRPSAGSGNYNTGDGCLSGDLDATVDGSGATNVCTFNGKTVDGTASAAAEYLVIRILASKNWTGKLESIAISWS
tara:strand:- start:11538 stop:17078 length:5541 start_codon:yes stop_codon:yes gene_type:complete